ncbi:antitoxin [Arsenicitalea aurantiaca]|uniref:Antitoxin n=1 Tax=Arsenicitalea aurantiaca TaxID=1783274 RepID=A0A433XBK4_9HYPH|nr:antitoxin [Arsenicitalea aurantiaca]
MQRIDADFVVSITDLKKNPSAAIAASSASGGAVGVLNHNRVVAYLVDPAVYEALLEEIDDARLAEIVRERQDEPTVEVAIDEL